MTVHSSYGPFYEFVDGRSRAELLNLCDQILDKVDSKDPEKHSTEFINFVSDFMIIFSMNALACLSILNKILTIERWESSSYREISERYWVNFIGIISLYKDESLDLNTIFRGVWIGKEANLPIYPLISIIKPFFDYRLELEEFDMDDIDQAIFNNLHVLEYLKTKDEFLKVLRGVEPLSRLLRAKS